MLWRLEGENMRIEFTSTDESWLIAISESSQAANTSGASPAGRKREADGDREKRSHAPPSPPLSSLYFLLYHYSCLLGSLCYVSYQLPDRHHRRSFQTICFNALPQKMAPVFQEATRYCKAHNKMTWRLLQNIYNYAKLFCQILRQHNE